MRIIGGIYKRRRFDVPKTFKARPTTDFAKENLFNVLANHIDFEEGLTALDLFAGTGSISVELVSRGCSRVVSVEKEPLHFSFINKVLRELKTDVCHPLRGDVFKFLTGCRLRFNFIFADPPYDLEHLDTLPTLVLDNKLLEDDGIFVLEHGKNYDFGQHPNCFDHRTYGSVHFSFFSQKPVAETSNEAL